MPALSYSVSDFEAFSKVLSADVNSKFTSIQTLLNTTKLDDDNIQDEGITRADKLKVGTANAIVINEITTGAMSELEAGTAGQFLQTTGASAAPIWADNPVQTQYPIIVGSAAQVTAGSATHASLVTAIAASSAGDSILIFDDYATTENVTISSQINIIGQGYGSKIDGSVTFDASSDSASLGFVRISGDVTLAAGADGVIINPVWLDAGADFLVDDTVTGEYLVGSQAQA